jgi:outer membrane biosynthesis protein TonB
MNNLLRMRYGRSGSMLDRVLVSAPCQQITPNPRWLLVLEVLFWIMVPVLVIRFMVPPTPRQMTVIDTSRLMEKPAVEMEKPVIPEPKQIPKIKPPVVPPAKPELPKVETVRKPQEIPSAPPQDVVRPSIVRPSGPRAVDARDYQPRIARERIRLETDSGTPAATRIRRETAVSDAPSGGVTIARTRGVAAVDLPVAAGYRVAALRRAPVSGDAASGGGTGGGGAPRQITRSGRPSGYAGLSEGNGPLVTAMRGRATAS